MKFFSDFVNILIWIAGLAILRFFVEFWIESQKYSIYSTTTGLIFFLIVVYTSYKVMKS